MKKMFPGSMITKKRVKLAPISLDFLKKCIVSEYRFDNTKSFKLNPETLEVEGNYNDWQIKIELEIYG